MPGRQLLAARALTSSFASSESRSSLCSAVASRQPSHTHRRVTHWLQPPGLIRAPF